MWNSAHKKEEYRHIFHCVCNARMGIDMFHAGRLAQCPHCRDYVIIPLQGDKMSKKPDFSISTTSLKLDLLTRKHWKDIHAIRADERNYNFEISLPSTAKETKAAIKRSAFPKGFSKSLELRFRVSTKDDDRSIGCISVSFAAPFYAVNLGFMFAYEAQGKGLGFEAINALCQWLQDEIRVEKISAMCDFKNVRCRAVLERVGFELEGVLKKTFYHPVRGWIDFCVYGFLKTDSPSTFSNDEN